MSYRIGRLSREARNERRRLRRLHRLTPAMERALLQVLIGVPPVARPHTIKALVRREILTPVVGMITRRGAFVAMTLMALCNHCWCRRQAITGRRVCCLCHRAEGAQ